MLQIHCPYCVDDRAEEEFTYSGEAGITRPRAPEELSDAEWGDYLFFRQNPRGLHAEMWFHAAGCRRYFKVLRHTVNYNIVASCRIHESLPAPAGDSGVVQS